MLTAVRRDSGNQFPVGDGPLRGYAAMPLRLFAPLTLEGPLATSAPLVTEVATPDGQSWGTAGVPREHNPSLCWTNEFKSGQFLTRSRDTLPESRGGEHD
jgi:hypothetical protein